MAANTRLNLTRIVVVTSEKRGNIIKLDRECKLGKKRREDITFTVRTRKRQ